MIIDINKLFYTSVGAASSIYIFHKYNQNVFRKPAHCASASQEKKLIGVQLFFRHGARTPLRHLSGIEKARFEKEVWQAKHINTDIPYVVETLDGEPRPVSAIEARYKKVPLFPGGMGAGVLTNLGRDQSFELGRRIRDKYIVEHKLISDVYDEKQILARSTNVNRCIESLQSVVAGVFGATKFKGTLRIKVGKVEEDILFPNPHKCPGLKQMEKFFQPYVKTMDGNKFLSRYIRYFTDDNTDKYIDLMTVRDHYVARKSHGLDVPLWLEAVNEHVQKEAGRVIRAYTSGSKDDHYLMMQFAVGPMFHMIINNFEKMGRSDKRTPRMHLYSAHDTTVVPLLVGLDIYDDTWPPYSADIAFELYQDRAGQLYIKVLYQQQDVILPGFKEAVIPFNSFKERIAPYVATPSQHKDRCHDMDLAREVAEFWEQKRGPRDVDEDEDEEYPPNM